MSKVVELRWIIRKTEPEVFERYQRELRRREYIAAQQSIVDARRSAQDNEANIVIF